MATFIDWDDMDTGDDQPGPSSADLSFPIEGQESYLYDPKHAKRMRKRESAPAPPFNFKTNRSEILIDCFMAGPILSAAKKFKQERNIGQRNLLVERRQHPATKSLVTILGDEKHRIAFCDFLENPSSRYGRIKILRKRDNDPEPTYCGVCYSQDHWQDDCRNCSYCQSPDHEVNQCPSQTIVLYSTKTLEDQKAIFSRLKEIAWKCPFRISAYDSPTGRRYLCRILGPENTRRVQYRIIEELSAPPRIQIKLRDRDVAKRFCMYCFDTAHATDQCQLQEICQSCNTRGHIHERCPQVSILAVNEPTIAFCKNASTRLKELNVQFDAKAVFHHRNNQALIVIKGKEPERQKILEKIPKMPNISTVKITDTDLVKPYCTYCGSWASHWTSVCPDRLQQQALTLRTQTNPKPGSTGQAARQKRERESIKMNVQDQDKPIWKYVRYVAKFTGLEFHGDFNAPLLANTLEDSVTKPIFYAIDVEKGEGMYVTWALCVCIVAVFKQQHLIYPAYFAYIDNTERIKRGVEYSSLTNQAIVNGISAELAKSDILAILKGQEVWAHNGDNDFECLGITHKDELDNNITRKDTLEYFRGSDNEGGALRDLVYTHFTDNYGRPKRIQEYSDEYVALGGHNAEIDARFTARLAQKIRKNSPDLKKWHEIKAIIDRDTASGLIFKDRGKQKAKIPYMANSEEVRFG